MTLLPQEMNIGPAYACKDLGAKETRYKRLQRVKGGTLKKKTPLRYCTESFPVYSPLVMGRLSLSDQDRQRDDWGLAACEVSGSYQEAKT